MPATGHHLALGDRVEDAAAVFGPLFEEVRLASYDAFAEDGAGLDDALLDSVGLVAGDGLEPALRRALARHAEGGLTILLGLPADLAGAEQVGRLATELDVALRTEVTTEDGVVLRVLAEEPAEAWQPPAPALPQAPAPREEVPAPAPAEHVDPPAPVPGPPRLRQAMLLGLLGAAVVLVVAVVLLVTVGTGAATVLLLVVLLGAVGVVAALALMVLRRLTALEQLLHDRLPDRELLDEQALFRRQVRNRTERIERVQRRSGERRRERFDAVDAALADLAGTRERVTALSALTARLAARGNSSSGPNGDDDARGGRAANRDHGGRAATEP